MGPQFYSQLALLIGVKEVFSRELSPGRPESPLSMRRQFQGSKPSLVSKWCLMKFSALGLCVGYTQLGG